MTVFESEDYLVVLKKLLEANREDRGYQGRIAKAAKVHPSYFSRVLSGEAHLNVDQAARLALHWNFDEVESEYWLLLVQLSRAQDVYCRRLFQRRLKELRAKSEDLTSKLKTIEYEFSQEMQNYFSHWLYPAIRVALSIPKLDRPAAIASRLEVSEARVKGALEYLKRIGFVNEEGDRWKTVKSGFIHAQNHPFVLQYHWNWRFKAMEKIAHTHKKNLHHTGVISLSHKDLERIKSLLKEAILKMNGIVHPSKEETLAGFCLDLFEL